MDMELCPWCHRATGVSEDGRFKRHHKGGKWFSQRQVCVGTGRKPVVANGQWTDDTNVGE